MSVAPRDAADAAPGPYALLAVLLGGMVGTALRLGLAEILAYTLWATLAVNLAGAFVLGVLYERLRPDRGARGTLWSALGPGAAGALTTFSTLQLEAVELVRDGAGKAAVSYLAASLLLGLSLAALGRHLGRRYP